MLVVIVQGEALLGGKSFTEWEADLGCVLVLATVQKDKRYEYRWMTILQQSLVLKGKTSLAHQFVEGEFLEGYDPTVENTYSKTVTLGKDEFHLHLVDTAGQDEYRVLPYSLIIGVHGYVLVYSVTSLHRLPVVLVGNKADLSPDRCVNLCCSWQRKGGAGNSREEASGVLGRYVCGIIC
ncbi:GTPase RhebL1 isoform X6 [Mesocricetus auratus]|uniref:GTPase RhebL1 isoform X6 n=1 Tax=Mesocricetus auratus TaxID=10036 RepID=A0ABM2Y8H2_MESAU|nr:GTPase RhebL1 isoform X6 [Mesocricetus auratus]